MLTNTATSFGSVTKIFHWITALLIFTVIPLGIIAHNMPFDSNEALTRKAFLFSMHKTLGITIFAIAVLRILWAVTQPRPGEIHPDRRVETFLARLVHWLLYGSLVLVPLTGWVHHAATEGFAPIWLPIGQNLPFVPESPRVAEVSAALHIIFERVLVASILLHVAGAVKHAALDRDGTLARMWFGRREVESSGMHRSGLAAPVAALVVWAGALGIGASLGLFAHADAAGERPELATVASDWKVQDGTLAIAVNQFGGTVRGDFSDWTAAISFEPETGAGQVEVTVAIASLTLGSVTSQALGSDYLDADGFPTALFRAEIRPDGEEYVADGQLTIKGVEVPARLSFALELEGETARAEGDLRLDRRDFGVGAGVEEANLGYPVFVTVSLTAQREASDP